MKETNSCFLRIASKAPVRIQQNLYTAFFPDKCFVRKGRLKFQVSIHRLRWNAENMTSSIITNYFPPKKLYHFLRAL